MEFDRKDQVKLKLFHLINLPIMQFSENQQLCGGVLKILYHLLGFRISPSTSTQPLEQDIHIDTGEAVGQCLVRCMQ
jgi:hypothetical protein